MLETFAKKAVDSIKEKDTVLVTAVDGYISDKEALHLRDFPWYARDNGVVIHFVPKQ